MSFDGSAKPIARILPIRTIRDFSTVKNGSSVSSHNIYYVKFIMGQIDIFTTPFKTQPLKNLIRTNKKSKQKYPSFKLIFCNNLDKQEHLFFTLQQTTCLALNTRYLNFQQMQDGLRFPFDCRTALGYFLATTGSGLVILLLLATLILARQGRLLVK